MGSTDLGEEGEDGDASMASDDGDIDVLHVQAGLLGVEGLGAHHVEGGHSEELLGVVDAHLLQGLGGDGDGGVDGVGDHGDASLGRKGNDAAIRGAREAAASTATRSTCIIKSVKSRTHIRAELADTLAEALDNTSVDLEPGEEQERVSLAQAWDSRWYELRG